jgi:hypothetical protein
MADEVNDVILHVWKLPVASNINAQTNSSSWGFLDRFLPNVGLGAYHTCLEYDHAFYTFAANVGVVRSSSNRQLGMPNTGQQAAATQPTYEGAIPLGTSAATTRAQAQQIVQYLQTHYFHSNAYHLVHRNCNHFTETLATALIQRDKFLALLPSNNSNDDSAQRNNNNNNDYAKCKLKTYPAHLNRLANTGGSIIRHDDDIVPCQVVAEARQAVLAAGGQPMSQSSNDSNNGSKTASLFNKKSNSTKRELTDKQKAILAKIKRGNST